MPDQPHALTKTIRPDYVVIATADRLLIRIPLIAYVGVACMHVLSMLLVWGIVEVGLLDMTGLKVLLPMTTAHLLVPLYLWGRWWTLDRTADAVRYFPWRLCALSAVCGVRVVERRTGKRNRGRAWAVDQELNGGRRVRCAGQCYAPTGKDEALALAETLGDWLHLPVTVECLQPAA